MENRFKVGDRVWNISHKWGVVIAIGTKGVEVDFENNFRVTYSFDTPHLFFKEQTLDYSRPKYEPKPGEWCLFWLEDTKFCVLDKFREMTVDGRYEDYAGDYWGNCATFPVDALPEHLK